MGCTLIKFIVSNSDRRRPRVAGPWVRQWIYHCFQCFR